MAGMSRLTNEQIEELLRVTAYSYEAGSYPNSMSEWARDYTAGDGGLLRIILELRREREETEDFLRNRYPGVYRRWLASMKPQKIKITVPQSQRAPSLWAIAELLNDGKPRSIGDISKELGKPRWWVTSAIARKCTHPDFPGMNDEALFDSPDPFGSRGRKWFLTEVGRKRFDL